MTTIAVDADAGVVVADTQITGDSIYRTQKVHRLPDGSLVGFAGNAADCYQVFMWLQGDQSTEAPKFPDSGFLMLRPDRTVWVAEEHLPFYPVMEKRTAIGSGAMAAQAALLCGKTALEAVEIAEQLDDGTSGPFQVFHLEETENDGPSGRKTPVRKPRRQQHG